ncbi:MAG: tyrosine-type recombinase/integrase [Desulfovibrio sp.]|nr:tyrosine-type recombinase/integrase [Desulfovibrio sp.]
MARKKQPLTAKTIESFVPPKTPFWLLDSDGLYLYYGASGRKIWRYRVRQQSKAGKANSYVPLGDYPDVSLAEARFRRDSAKRQLAKGVPLEQIKFGAAAVRVAAQATTTAESGGLTFGEAARAWMDADAPNVSEAVRRHRESRYAGYLEKPLSDRPIESIEQHELIAAAESPLTKSVSGRPATTVHRILVHMIGQIFDYARMTHRELKDLHADAHLSKLVRKAPPVKHRPCIVLPSDLGELLRKIHAWYFKCQNPQTGLAMKLMPLVAVRPVELLGALWEEVDLNKCLWTIPGARMKMRDPHIVPLSHQSMAIIQEAKKFFKDSKYVFPTVLTKGTGHISQNTLGKILERLGYDTGKDICCHGFRGTFATMLNESGLFRREAIKVQLAHMNKDTVDDAYNHAIYLPERQKMMQTWADYLDALRNGTTQTLREWAEEQRTAKPNPFND